ncbi:MAG: MBG domain-containing protein [Collinsella sp.]
MNGESIISVKLADTTFTLPTMSGGDTSQVGTYTVTLTGGTAKNYEFVGVPGVLTVKKPEASKELTPALTGLPPTSPCRASTTRCCWAPRCIRRIRITHLDP